MGESMKCDICGKPATVHLTQIIENKVQKVDLCESCAQEKGVTSPEHFSLTDLIGKAAGEFGEEVGPADPNGLRCPNCGCTPRSFKKHGRLGCPQCYEALKSILMPMLENMHKDIRHKGKKLEGVAEQVEFSQQINDLEENLRRAIEDERYEDAAAYRDQIRSLREHAQQAVGKKEDS